MNEFNENNLGESAFHDSLNTDEAVSYQQNSNENTDNNVPAVDNMPVYTNPYNPQNTAPVIKNFEPVNYSPVEPKKPIANGLKVFALIMAAVILVTGSCLFGYVIGLNSGAGKNYAETTLDLTPKPTNTPEYTAAQVYEIVNKSVVGIIVYDAKGNASSASGVVYTDDGYIITNDHIYDGIVGAKFKVIFYDGKEYPATFVAGDTRSDLAVLKVDGKNFTPAVFGNSDELINGENIVAIGRPNHLEANGITEGIVSLNGRRVSTTSNYSTKMIQISAPINSGSSGGALVNMYGQVVGITSSKVVATGYEGIAFAIPTSSAKGVIESLIAFGCVNNRSRLGISYRVIDSVTMEINNYSTTGVYVVSVAEDSDLNGKLTAGDIITHINGRVIDSDNAILDVIESTKPEETVTLNVLDSTGKSKEITAKLLHDTGTSSYKH